MYKNMGISLLPYSCKTAPAFRSPSRCRVRTVSNPALMCDAGTVKHLPRHKRRVACRLSGCSREMQDNEVGEENNLGGDADEEVHIDFTQNLRALLPPQEEMTHTRIRQWSPISLAFLGDCVWELSVRQAFFFPRTHPQSYNESVKQAVRAESQQECGWAEFLVPFSTIVCNSAVITTAKCFDWVVSQEDFLSEQEMSILMWGRNASGNKPSRLKPAVYKKATAIECLVGYLYLLNPERLNTLMKALGYIPLGSSQDDACSDGNTLASIINDKD